ncbi:MAG: EAL domain-containing protein [Roseococcus sp.]|nr:EAL domain-containing protein [Roseococcus sp.]
MPWTDVGAQAMRRLTRAYLVALALLGALILAGGLLSSELLRRQSDRAAALHAAAQLPFTVQRIARLAPLAATGRDAPALATVEEEARVMLGVLERWGVLAERIGLFSDPGAAFRHTGVQPLLQAAESFALRALAIGPLLEAGQPDLAAAAAFALHEEGKETLAPLLRDGANTLALRTETQMAWIQRLHSGLLTLALLLLAAQAVLIFGPLTRRIGRLAARLEREARTDSLTGLMNRRAVTEALALHLARGEPLALIAVDLDHFKEANDTEGHEAGDALLRAAARRLRRCLRRTDIVGRIGGDEFVAFLPGVREEGEVRAIAERVRRALHESVPYRNRRLRLGATLGVALAPGDATTGEALLRAADAALMRAKRAGRGTVGRAAPEDSARFQREAAIAEALAGAGELPGLEVHLQPLLPLDGHGGPFAVESLARWSHPELGPIRAPELFGVAQRIGRAVSLGRQALALALREFSALPRGEGLRLCVNLSAAELLAEDGVEGLEATLRAAGLDFSCLVVEVQEESLLGRSGQRGGAALAALRAAGAWIAVDDFGGRNLSLAALLGPRLDLVKLDRALVARMAREPEALRLGAGLVALLRHHGAEVVGKGVETAAEGAALRAAGCRIAQGDALAPPMTGPELAAWMRENGALALRSAP